MKSSLIEPTDARWQSVLEQCRHDFYHLPGYVELEASRVGGAPRAFYAEESGFFFFLPMVLRPLIVNDKPLPGYETAMDAVSPYGYPCPLILAPDEKTADSEFILAALESFRTTMQNHGICSMFVRLHPLLNEHNADIATLGSLNEHGQTVWIDLSVGEEELWRQTRATYRNNIVNLKKNGLVAEMDSNLDNLERFVEVYDTTMREVNAADWYFFGIEYFRKMKEALGPRLSLCVVRDGDSISSAGLFTECSGIVQYHLSGSDPNARYRDSAKLMLDFAKSWAKARGNTQFHFGGGFGSQNDNLFFFKSGFSKMRATFCSWRLIFDSEIYSAAVQAWESKSKIKADNVNGYFPAYRKPFGG